MENVVPFGHDEDVTIGGNPAVAKALSLMKEALATLDRGDAGFTNFACHLSLAIDLAEEQRVPQTETECQSMLDILLNATAHGCPSPQI